jgi:hypothetical protein
MEDGLTRELLRDRVWQCRIEWRALEMWLAFLTPIKWLTVGIGTVLSVFASATVLAKVFGETSGLVGGLCGLGAALLTGLHAALKCDAHQAECRHQIQSYKSLESAYESAQLSSGTELAEKQEALQARFEGLTSKQTVAAPRRFRERAEEQARESDMRSHSASPHFIPTRP